MQNVANDGHGDVCKRILCDGANDSLSSGRNPLVSEPNTKKSPGRNSTVENGVEPRVVSANMRLGLDACVSNVFTKQIKLLPS